MEKFIDPVLNQSLGVSHKPFPNTLYTFCEEPPPSSLVGCSPWGR